LRDYLTCHYGFNLVIIKPYPVRPAGIDTKGIPFNSSVIYFSPNSQSGIRITGVPGVDIA
jgi:hypothetical protein